MKYTKDFLQTAVRSAVTFADVCRSLGVTPSTGGQSYVANRIRHFDIDISHFAKRPWNKGLRLPQYRTNTSTYLVKGSKIGSDKLKKRLIDEGIKPFVCESCGVKEWLGEPVVLELDHIDSDHFNNELSNLQILCPNCHATFTRRRINERKPSGGTKE